MNSMPNFKTMIKLNKVMSIPHEINVEGEVNDRTGRKYTLTITLIFNLNIWIMTLIRIQANCKITLTPAMNFRRKGFKINITYIKNVRMSLENCDFLVVINFIMAMLI